MAVSARSRPPAAEWRWVIAAIAGASLTTWRREMAVTLSLTARAAKALLLAIVVAALLFGIGLAAVTGSALDGQEIPQEVLASIALSSASGMCLITGLVAVIVNLVAPRETALGTLLDMLPVSRATAALGACTPVLAVGVCAAVILSIPTLWLSWRSVGHLGLVVLLMVAVVLCAITLNVLVCAAFAAVRRAAERWVRLPPHLALAVGGGTLILACLRAVGPTVLTDGVRLDARIPGWVTLTPQGLIAAGIRGESWGTSLAAVGGLVLWCVLAFAVFVGYFSGRLERAGAPGRRPRVLAGIGVPRGPRAGLVFIDILVLLRAPQFIVTVLLVPVGAVAARLGLERGLPGDVTSALAGVLLVAGMVLVGQATGVVLPHQWVVRAAVGSGREWVATKMASTAIVHGVIAGAAWGCVSLAGVPLGGNLVTAAATIVLAWASALLGGAIAPYDDRHSLSPGVTLAVSGLLYAVSSWVISAMPFPEGAVSAVLLLTISGAYIAAYVLVCARLVDREPARA